MAQHPPPPPDAIIQQHGTPQPEHGTNFNLDPGLLDGGFAFSGVTHGYCLSGAVDEAHAHAVNTGVFAPPAGLGVVSYPTAGDHPLPTESNLMAHKALDFSPNLMSQQTLFYAAGSRTWTPPEEWQCPDTTFLPGSYPLAADNNQVVVDGQGPAILQSPPSIVIGVPVTSLAPYHQHQQQQQQQQQQTHSVAQPIIPGHGGLKHRLQQLRRGGSSSSERVQDGLTCWRCRASHTGCDTDVPCGRCRNSSEPAAIPCERGLVCVVTGRSGICHLPPKSSRPKLPPALGKPDECIRGARWRRQKMVDRLVRSCRSDPTSSGNQNDSALLCSVLFKVVKAKVQEAKVMRPFEVTGLIQPDDAHCEVIISILWELEDNLDAARLLDIGSVADLAALLETASQCEIAWGRANNKVRIVYIALQCLRSCLEAVRLLVAGALPPTSPPPVGAADEIHTHCAQANECIVPGLRNLGKYAPRYVEVLTTELFSRSNDRSHNWLLVFYSLCIQGYVRRGLMLLEEKRRSLMPGPAPGTMQPDSSSARQYLQKAVCLFGHISERGKGKLGKKIREARAKPSAYAHLHLSLHPTRPGGGGSWEMWHEEGFLEYLARVFELPPSPSYTRQPSSAQPHHRAAAGALLVPGAGPSNWGMMETVQVQMQAEMAVSGGGSGSSGIWANMGCWNPSPPPPSNISVPSFYSMTTTGQGDYTPEPNTRGWMTPSIMSLSTATMDDDSMTDSNIDFEWEYGATNTN